MKADSRQELVENLNELSPFGLHQSIGEYMKGVAVLCRTEHNVVIRTDSTENFVDDMKEMGFIIELNEGELTPERNKFKK